MRAAIDDLPLEFHRALEHVAIVVSDGGSRQRAYGLYQGDTVAQDYFHDRIVIFRDTLVRDFGHDPELLKAQVTRTCATSSPIISGGTRRACAGWGCSPAGSVRPVEACRRVMAPGLRTSTAVVAVALR